MTFYARNTAILMLGLMLCNCASSDAAVAKEESQILVDTLLTEIQRALVSIQNSTVKETLPPLDSIVLTLSTQFAKDINGKLNLYIVSLGGDLSSETSQKLVLVLRPPAQGTSQQIAGESVSAQLSEAVIVAAKAAHDATKREPPLLLTRLSANLKFVVKKEGSAGVKFTIMPVTAEIGGGLKSIETQEIAVVFGKSKSE